MSGQLDKKIDNWRKKLLDLSKRNRLINFKPTKTKSLPLQGSKVSSIENLNAGRTLYIRKSKKDVEKENEKGEIEEKTVDVKLTDVRSNELLPTRDRENAKNSLNNLRVFKNRFSRERGIDSFYLAVSFLEWYESVDSDEKINSPLILLPVDIEEEIIKNKERHNYKITYRGKEPIVNPALKKKLKDDFEFTIPEEELGKENMNEFISEIDDNVSGGFENWQVKKKLVLGIFDFQKVSLYRDLEENRNEIKDNETIRALNDDYTDLNTDVDVPDQKELDDEINHEETYQVLDADPSQQIAIEAAKSGKSFVLEGPPGTGKSQTITNIISEKIANGEKVLFVSEKKAALEVVMERLEGVGLGRFCLDVHSGNKKKVLEQIEEEMKRNSGQEPEADQDLKKLKLRQEKLNKYGEILNEEFGNIEKSPYEAIGKIAKRKEAYEHSLGLENIFDVSEKQFENIKDNLKQLKEYEYEIRNFESHTWKKSDMKSWGLKTGDKMGESLDGQKELIQEMNDFSTEIDIPVNSVKEMRELLKFLELINECPIGLEQNLVSKEVLEKRDQILDLRSLEKEKDDKLEGLEQNYREIPQVDVESFIEFMKGKEWAAKKENFSELRSLEEKRERILSKIEDNYKEIPEVDVESFIEFMKEKEWATKKEKFSKLRSLEEEKEDLLAEIEKNYKEIPDVDAEEALEVIEDKYWLMRKLSREFKNKRAEMLEFAKEDYNPDHEDLVEDLEKLEELDDLNEEIRELTEFKDLLGKTYKGRNTEWDKLEDKKDKYWKLREKITGKTKKRYNPDHEEIIEDLEKLENLRELSKKISGLNSIQVLLGKLYDGRNTDWSELEEDLNRYWNMREEVIKCAKEPYEPNHEELLDDLKELKDINKLENDISSLHSSQKLLGKLYDGRNTNWAMVEDFLNWLDKYQDFSKFREDKLDREVETNIQKFEKLEEDTRELLLNFDEEKEFFKESMKNSNLDLESKKFDTHINCLNNFEENLNELKSWTEFSRRLDELKKGPAEDFVLKYLKKRDKPEKLTDSFVKSFYTDFLDQIFKETDLDQFSSKEMDQVLDDFKNLDKKQEKIAKNRLLPK